MASGNSRLSRTFIIFYIVVVYSFASFGWWGYLLLQKNKEAFQHRQELISHREAINSIAELEASPEYQQAKEEFRRQNFMILGEGLVFLLILIFGIFQIRNSYYKEMALARQQSNFLLSITHELKSPLASIKLSLQTFIKRQLEREKLNKLANNSLDDVERLETLVDNILLAAKIENRQDVFSREQCNLSLLMHELVERFRHGHPQRSIEADIEPDIYSSCDKMAISSAVNNLLENAVKYSEPDSEVGLSLQRQKNEVVIAVSDSGKGIPDAERSHIFKKFYRVGDEETRTTKGTGLGLFIVKSIIDIHNGRIEVLDNRPSGTIFRIVLPKIIQL